MRHHRRPPEVLLMTATVVPHAGVGNLQVTDPQEREQQYRTAFAAALDELPSHFAGLVLAENSGADLTAFRELAGSRRDVELLSVPSGDAAEKPGRGYLETQLVDAALRSSRLVARHPETLVWKTTGRYRVRNLARISMGIRPGRDLYVNLRRHPEPWADMWVYGATRRGMGLVTDRLDDLREVAGHPSERAMFRLLSDLADRGENVDLRLPAEPRISGIRGYDGKSYDSWDQRAKWLLRSAVRRAAPGWWI